MKRRMTEAKLAKGAVAILRHAGVSNEEILRDYTKPMPQADRAYEKVIKADFGVVISALKVKTHMRQLVGA
jgi:hypothetical protein